jgi:hypothetical protein
MRSGGLHGLQNRWLQRLQRQVRFLPLPSKRWLFYREFVREPWDAVVECFGRSGEALQVVHLLLTAPALPRPGFDVAWYDPD